MKPESMLHLDFGVMVRKERRKMLTRIRTAEPKRAPRAFFRDEKTEAACARAILEIKDLTRETISRGLAVRLIGGTDTQIAGEWCRGTGSGAIFKGNAPCSPEALLTRLKLAITGKSSE